MDYLKFINYDAIRMLILKGINKSFHQRGRILNNLDLEVKPGESVSVMGPSGSGKSTLLNLIGLLDKPDSGTILFRGEELNNYSHDEAAHYRNKNIGFVFQDHHLLPYLTVYDNVMLPVFAVRHSGDEIASINKHCQQLMEKIGIKGIANKYPNRISGGEAQRAAIVRALVNSPSLLLADEPTGALDSKNSEIFGQLLLEMNHDLGISMIIATHSHILASRMSTRLKLEDGRLIKSV